MNRRLASGRVGAGEPFKTGFVFSSPGTYPGRCELEASE
jgi:hypothetical protein